LTVRHIEALKQPKRILIDKYLETPIDFNIFSEEAETILITSEKVGKEKLKQLEEKENIKIFVLPLKNEKFEINDILNLLKEENIIHVLVEGGRGLITSFIKNKIFDKLSINLKTKHIKQLGSDVLLQLYTSQ